MNDALILAKLVILLSAFKHLPVPKTTADEISDININSNKKTHVWGGKKWHNTDQTDYIDG